MEKVAELKCSLWKDQLILTITTDLHIYESAITHATIRPYEKQLSISLADVEQYLTSQTLDQVNQTFSFQPHNILIISIGSLGSSDLKLTIKCLLTQSNHSRRSSFLSSQQQQRLLKVQNQNFQLKLKMQMLNARVEQQQERIKEIMSLVNMQMVRIRDQFQRRIDDVTIPLSRMSKTISEGM